MKKLAALILFSIMAAMSSQATVAWYENWNYTIPTGGSFNVTNCSVGLWVNTSGTGLHNLLLNPTNYNKLEVSTTGNAVSSRDDDDYRLLAITNGAPITNVPVHAIYASFTVTCTNLPNGIGSYFASFFSTRASGGGFFGRIQAFTGNSKVPNTWRLGVTANAAATNAADGGYPFDLALNTPYQVVEEWEPVTAQTAIIWVNPVDLTDDPLVASSDPFYFAPDSIGAGSTNPPNAYAFRQASSFGNGFWVISNLVVTTTFAEAVTNIMSTNAAPPVIVYQPVGTTNFPFSSFNITSVANGQGLGRSDFTYQWRTNGVNYPNPLGNSNVLGFVSASATFGTNDVDVIVKTPYGLTATSSPVKVAIDAMPQPPVFQTQPASLTLYRGQNAIFSTSVASPGTPTFTWYSNNVVVPASFGSTFSSTLEIDNVTTNNAATFRVAVTNNTFPDGVVSTNAVLTVQNPNVVSIAYLHQLVDKTTWQATNLPPSIAYEVTGHVTTYTNVTTANTSSYYLQDGTAGINIFITGGSTFRPQLGDVVDFIGVVSSFTSGLELFADTQPGVSTFPYTSATVLSNDIAGLPSPQPIGFSVITNVANMNTNLGGRYVQISDVYFGTRAGTTNSIAVNNYLLVTNSGGQKFTIWFPNLDLDVIVGRTNPAYAYNVNGIIASSNSLATNILLVTRWSDVVTNPPAIAITCPGNITVTSSVPTNITFVVTASGGCTTPTVTSIPASGSAFSVGVTTVNSSASDGCHDTNTCSFTVTVVNPSTTIIPTIPPHISTFSLNGANVVINGTNGQSTGVYYLLASTNMALPLGLWQAVATNVVNTNGPNGAFTFTGTNVVTPGGQKQFYTLSNTNAVH